MNKKLLLYWYFIQISLAAFAGEPFPLRFMEKTEVVIDGALNDWPVTIPFFLESDSQILVGFREAPEDFRAILWCFFDAENFYLAAHYRDLNPGTNPFRENEIYRGDNLNFFLGFHEETNDSFYSERDFQGAIGLGKNIINTIIWQSGPRRLMKGEEIEVAESEKEYIIEARIPLSNFIEDLSLEAGRILQIDLSATGGEPGNRIAMNWQSDGSCWITPATWVKAQLHLEDEPFKAFTCLTPPRLYAGAYNRIHIYYNGKPWQSSLILDEETLIPDSEGGLTLTREAPGEVVLTAEVEGKLFKKFLTIIEKENYYPPTPLLDRLAAIASALVPLLIAGGAVWIYRKNVNGQPEKN